MKIALTGGMGCGKTFVLSLFAETGAAVIETDALSRELLDNDPSVADELREHFGGTIFRPDGSPDRKAIAALVFDDRDALRTLEAILHPKIRSVWMKRLADLQNDVAVVEIPLLFEKNLEKLFDISVCVTADRSAQIARLAGRGFGENEALIRMAKQMPLPQKELRADFIISNNGDAISTRKQVSTLMERISPEN